MLNILVLLSIALGSSVARAQDDGKETKKDKAAEKTPIIYASNTYQGPLRIFNFDYDLNISSGEGDYINIFLWNEATSSYNDIANSGLPEVIKVPIRDWEHGIEDPHSKYNRIPVYMLVGSYYDGGMRIQNPGNSYFDQPIKLSNGEQVNPRFYYIDPQRSYADVFRTSLSKGNYPLAEGALRMVSLGRFGKAFPLFKLVSRPDVPAYTFASTIRGNLFVEWEMWTENLINAGELVPGSKFDRIRAYSNPGLSYNEKASGSTIGRADGEFSKKKIIEFGQDIDNLLTMRIDRTNINNPKPNVYVFSDDNVNTIKRAKELFESKIKGVKDYDGNMYRAHAPIRLILWNTAPKWAYQPLANEQNPNKAALSDGPMDLAEVMLFDSDYRYSLGAVPYQKFNPKNPVAKIVSLAFGVSEQTVISVMQGKLSCNALYEDIE